MPNSTQISVSGQKKWKERTNIVSVGSVTKKFSWAAWGKVHWLVIIDFSIINLFACVHLWIENADIVT